MNDIMIDIETTDTRFTAGVLTIAAVKFNRDTGEISDKFYRRLGYDQAVLFGTVSESTMAWWNRQKPEVRAEAFNCEHDAYISAYELIEFCKGARGVWGNGALFDLGILDHWLHALGFGTAWGFNVRDCRTIEEIANARGIYRKQWVRKGDHHNALDDAIYQSEYVSGMWRAVVNV